MAPTLRALPPILCLACCLSGQRLLGQTVRGTLLDRETGAPITVGRITLLTEEGDTVSATLTNQEGFFSVSSPTAGSFRLSGEALGYRESTVGIFEIQAEGWISLEFRLQPEPIVLDGVSVNVRGLVREPALLANGFVDRLQQGLGRFLTPEAIENAHALRVNELFYGIPRVFIQYRDGREQVMMQGSRGYCYPRVVLDGVLLGSVGDLDQFLHVGDVEAVEVYRSASEIPLQYGGTGNGCGVIIFWTKRR